MKHGTTRYYPTLLLCLFLGFLGIHRFYNGRVLSGILQLCTCGGLGWWWLADFVLILLGKFKDEDGNPITSGHRATSPAQTSSVMYNMLGADQKDYGPVTLDQMRQWIAEGRSNAQTHMRPGGTSDWRPLNTIPELAALLPPPVPCEMSPPVPAANLEFKMSFCDTVADFAGLYAPPPDPKQLLDQHWDSLNDQVQWTYMDESEKTAWLNAHHRAADKQYKALLKSGLEAALNTKIEPQPVTVCYRTKSKAYAAKLKDDEERRRQLAAAAAVPPPPLKPNGTKLTCNLGA